jgi:anti-sigma B factor antagonist
MAFAITEREGAVIIGLDGAILGGPEANSLNTELHRLIDKGSRLVIIDLGKVTLMNSSGLGLLIGGLTTMRHAGGELRLAAANENIRNLITITKLHTIFQIYPTVDDAIAGSR